MFERVAAKVKGRTMVSVGDVDRISRPREDRRYVVRVRARVR